MHWGFIRNLYMLDAGIVLRQDIFTIKQLEYQDFGYIGNSFVKHAIVGGGFTSEKEYKFLEKKYGKDKFLNGYGQTECSPLISFVYPDSPKDKRKKQLEGYQTILNL